MKKFILLLLLVILLISEYSLAITHKTDTLPSALLRLKNEKNFQQTVSMGGQCADSRLPCQKGVQQFISTQSSSDPSDADKISVNSITLVKKYGSRGHLKAYKAFEQFLHQSYASLKPGFSLATLLTLFNEGDNGVMYDTHLIAPISVDYPGVNQHRAVYALEGADGPNDIMVRVFGQKGSTLFMVSGKIPYEDFYRNNEARFKKCNPPQGGPEEWKKADQCYYQEFKKDPLLYKAILKKAHQLTEQFALVR